MAIDVSTAFSVVDLSGVLAGAASGALVARNQEDFDIAGVLGLAFATGLSGFGSSGGWQRRTAH